MTGSSCVLIEEVISRETWLGGGEVEEGGDRIQATGRASLQRLEYYFKGLLRGSETVEELKCLSNQSHRREAKGQVMIIIL